MVTVPGFPILLPCTQNWLPWEPMVSCTAGNGKIMKPTNTLR